MNCNEEFVIKAIGKLTLLYPDIDQLKVRDLLYEALTQYEVTAIEKGLITSDIEEKMMIYLASKRIEGRSDKTLYNYKLILLKLAMYIHKPISTINIMDLRMFIAVITKDHKPSTINTIMSTIKSFFGWLELEEYIPKNPTKKLKNYKMPKRLRKSLTVKELEKLRDSCLTLRERALLEHLFATGCRLSEVVNTNRSDLNYSNHSIKVIGKGDKEREVYFSEKSDVHLSKYLTLRNDECPALFVTERKPIKRMGARAIQKEIGKIGKRAGFDKPIFPHLLRHTMATLAVQAGAKLTTVQYLLGHEDPSTSQIYAETSVDEIKLEYKQHLIQ